MFFRERKIGPCNDQAGLDLIWLLAGVYLCAASVFVRSHKMNTLRQTFFFAVSSSHTRAKNVPRPVRPSPPTLCAYLTSLYHHHLQPHRKYFTLLLLRARLISLEPRTFFRGRVYCSGVKYLNCARKIMALVKKIQFYLKQFPKKMRTGKVSNRSTMLMLYECQMLRYKMDSIHYLQCK